MNFPEAKAIVEALLRPLTLDDLLDSAGAGVKAAKGAPDHARARILGSEPQETVLSAFATYAPKLRYHGVTPVLPAPAAEAVADEKAFLALIRRFHDRDYTVRIPDVIPLSPALQRLARALELILHQPVTALLFWSKAGAKAIVHYDNEDNIIVQLSGRKRWYVSTEPALLPNDWQRVGEAPPVLGPHEVHDMDPGDLLFIPRGTPHTVDSTTESLHLAILFRPVTLRDAIVAALDRLSDSDRTLRDSAVKQGEGLPAKAADALERLLAHCRTPGFLAEAMEHRSSRTIGGLPALPKPDLPEALTPATRVAHADLAISHLFAASGLLHFSVPGEQMGVHPGAEPALRFIRDHSSFRVGDIPGLADEVRIALVERLASTGFLRVEG